MAVSNSSGVMQQVRTYDAYGVTVIANTLRFQYTGQAAIPEVALLYYKARFYNPALGRFMQTDPIGYEDNLNLYAYVRNDPLNKIDPYGEQACNAQKDCIEATNFKSQNSDGQTAPPSANIDAVAVAELPNHESTGTTENAVHLDESASGNVITTGSSNDVCCQRECD